MYGMVNTIYNIMQRWIMNIKSWSKSSGSLYSKVDCELLIDGYC